MVPAPSSSTATARVDYRCEACRHVWTTTKDGTDPLTQVTERKRTPIKSTLPPNLPKTGTTQNR